MDDLLFAFEVICHADYDGIRYDDSFTAIKGVEEYNAGTASTISGITLSNNNQTITFEYKAGEFPPSILSFGLWVTPEPRHYYEGLSVAEMRASEKSRSQAIGFVPFKL
jgi:peptide/nickel transport system substrate-binding protein